MTTQSQFVNLAQARVIAESGAKSDLEDLVTDSSMPLLQDTFLEADHCWMFFRNKAIHIPAERSLCDCAYVVSRKGSLRHIADFSENPERLQAYLQTMSDHFGKGEE